MPRPRIFAGPLSAPRPKALRAGLAAALAGATLGVGMVTAPPPATAATPLGGVYVALGDSYTSGPGIPTQRSDSGLCSRSDKNYPSLIAAEIKPTSFKDVSCSGAVTANLTGTQFGNPPQFDALTADTTLVTLSMGGNDIGFGSLTITCTLLSYIDPKGAPCKTLYTFGGTDSAVKTITDWAPKLGTAIQTIKQKSPKAKILVVGYPALNPDDKSKCAVEAPTAAGDMPWTNMLNRKLNEVMAAQSAAHGATFVDIYTSSVGHDACQAPGVRWVEGIFNAQGAAPIHPNALGMQNAAKQALLKLR